MLICHRHPRKNIVADVEFFHVGAGDRVLYSANSAPGAAKPINRSAWEPRTRPAYFTLSFCVLAADT